MNNARNKQNGYAFLSSSSLLHVGLISVICMLIYWPSLHSYFVGSDFHMIPLSKYDGWDSFSKIFWGDNIYRAQGEGGYYRPLYILSFTVDYFLWKFNPLGYHLTNIVVHLLTSVIVYIIASYIITKRVFAVMAGLIFAVHPIHAEAVAYISPRVSSIATLFYILSFALYLRYTSRKSTLVLAVSLFSFMLSLGSKEIAATLPFIIFLYTLCLSPRKPIRQRLIQSFRESLPYLVILVGYLVFRYFILGRIAGIVTDNVIENTPLQINPVSDIKNFFSFTFPLLIPIELGIKKMVFLWDNRLLYSCIAGIWWLGVIFVFFKYVLRSNKLTFTFLWFLITLLPVHQFQVSLINHWGARFLYLPSVAFCVFVCIVLSNISEVGYTKAFCRVGRKSACIIIFSFIFVFYSVLLVGKIYRMDEGTKMASQIIAETKEKLPNSLENSVIYFIGLPNTFNGAVVYGPLEKALHVFHSAVVNTPIKQVILVASKRTQDPDIRVNFVDERTFVLEIMGADPWEYLAEPWSLAREGQVKDDDVAVITNVKRDVVNDVTTLRVVLKDGGYEGRKKYFFVYEKGHVCAVEIDV